MPFPKYNKNSIFSKYKKLSIPDLFRKKHKKFLKEKVSGLRPERELGK